MRQLKKEYKYWNHASTKKIDANIKKALKSNINYYDQLIMGVPGSHLDKKEFSPDPKVLNGSTFLQVFMNNPNHIGVHTLGEFEPYFKGTHKLERDVIDIIAIDILDGKPREIDGYVSSGGTEGNIQAIWIFRNYFNSLENNSNDNIAIFCSCDTHYSIDKAANILNLSLHKIPVDEYTRQIDYNNLSKTLNEVKKQGVKNIIFVANMMTTMFGSHDDINEIVKHLKQCNLNYKIHVDAAYGGFLYPFSISSPKISFDNEHVTSFSLDAHKMLQAPYGTGIFLIRKGYFKNSKTQSANYVIGKDYTLIGSRSGANAISIYKILLNYGPYDWQERMEKLVTRAEWFFNELKMLNIKSLYFEGANIVTIQKKHVNSLTAEKYGLVPDDTKNPKWYKVVIMGHVKRHKLHELLKDLK